MWGAADKRLEWQRWSCAADLTGDILQTERRWSVLWGRRGTKHDQRWKGTLEAPSEPIWDLMRSLCSRLSTKAQLKGASQEKEYCLRRGQQRNSSSLTTQDNQCPKQKLNAKSLPLPNTLWPILSWPAQPDACLRCCMRSIAKSQLQLLLVLWKHQQISKREIMALPHLEKKVPFRGMA